MAELKILLSYLRAISQIYEHSHWQSAGINYYADHLLYQRLYEETVKEIDQVAEKAIGISNDSKVINPIEDSKITTQIVSKFTGGEFNPESFPEIAIAAEKELLKLIDSLMSKKPSDGEQNMLQGIADGHQSHLYLLQQRDKKASLVMTNLSKIANKLDIIGEIDMADEIDGILTSMSSDVKKREWLGLKDMKSIIMFEMSDILARIRRIEESKFPDEEREMLLRERYRALKKELKEKYDTDF